MEVAANMPEIASFIVILGALFALAWDRRRERERWRQRILDRLRER